MNSSSVKIPDWIVREVKLDVFTGGLERVFAFNDTGYRERVSMNSFFHHPVKVRGIRVFRCGLKSGFVYTIEHRDSVLRLEETVRKTSRRAVVRDYSVVALDMVRDGRAILCAGLFDFYNRIGYNRAKQRFTVQKEKPLPFFPRR